MMFIRTINDKLLYRIFAFAQKNVANFEANPKSCFNYDGLGDLEFDSVSLSHEKAGW